MSRSGYDDDVEDMWRHICWRGAVNSAIKGRRGQAFLKEMLASLDAMPVKRLITDELEAVERVRLSCSHWGLIEQEQELVCAIGSVGRTRGIDMTVIDPYDSATVSGRFGISEAMAREIVYVNDEEGSSRETPEQRFDRVRRWVVGNIKEQV